MTLASATNDWVKAQTMELVPDDNVTGVYGTGDLRRVAKTVEMANKIHGATQPVKTPWVYPDAGNDYWAAQAAAKAEKAKAKNKGRGKGQDKGKAGKKGSRKW